MIEEGAPAWAQEVIRSVGRIEGKIDAFQGNFATHVAEDKALANEIQEIKLNMATMAGERKVGVKVMSAVTGIGSVVGGGLFHVAMKKLGW